MTNERIEALLLDMAFGLVLFLIYLGLFLIAAIIAYAAMLSGNTAVMVLFGVAGCCRGAYLLFVSARIQIDEVPATDLDMPISGIWVQEPMRALMNPPISLSNNLPC
ncbi:hypothetical protein B1757_02575 [Acidithiobacillus marinus]|uniref:Uncharacterized protein n=1 Tax=Acidithiobacillus marinus TaxID=187490 RepID=A0A2I1DPQ8_9PROT|nr:hypothetical protein [Acidithiobacillus marinus]PKY11863.1 hypothetical protein B1757_02575 [Acidithiobacillus marinus]